MRPLARPLAREVVRRAKLSQGQYHRRGPLAAQLLVRGDERFQVPAQLGPQFLPPGVWHQAEQWRAHVVQIIFEARVSRSCFPRLICGEWERW